MQLGMIGLGLMGTALSARLIDAGLVDVVVALAVEREAGLDEELAERAATSSLQAARDPSRWVRAAARTSVRPPRRGAPPSWS